MGKIHLYTGNGKGKTTAALGLAFRAMGCGKKSIMIQFLKNGNYAELNSCAYCKQFIIIEQYGLEEFYIPSKSNYLEHRLAAKDGYDRALNVMTENDYDIVILDEVVHALILNLLTHEEIVHLFSVLSEKTELIITGRDAPESLYAFCDLITEMKEIKHYFNDGIAARKGIEF